MAKMKITVPFNTQTQIDSELFNAYLAWLLQFAPPIGLAYLQCNPVFMFNMGAVQYQRLVAEMQTRAG
jgi:hypothetical protein